MVRRVPVAEVSRLPAPDLGRRHPRVARDRHGARHPPVDWCVEFENAGKGSHLWVAEAAEPAARCMEAGRR